MIDQAFKDMLLSIVKVDEGVIELLVGILAAHESHVISTDELTDNLIELIANMNEGINRTRTIIEQL